MTSTTATTHDAAQPLRGRTSEQWHRIPPHGRLLIKIAAGLTVLVGALSAASALVSTDIADFPGVVSVSAILA
jgi:hypothetical protein